MSWPMVNIGSVCTLKTGGTPKTSVTEYYENGNVPWIVSGDIHQGEIFDCEKKITELAVNNSNARFLPKDSVLIALNGQGKTRGTVALLRMHNATCNQSIVSINPNDKDQLSSEYLFYYLKSQYQQIRNITGDKDRAGLNMPLIRGIEIPLPPIAEQKRIAAILDKADAIRQKRQQAIKLADDFLRSVFLEMFGDPVTNPKRWEVKEIDQVCTEIVDCVNRTAPSVEYVTPYKMIRTTNIRDYKIDLSSVRYVEKEVYDKWVRRLTPELGDVIFTREAPAGEAGVINFKDKVFLGQRTMHFRPDVAQINPNFLLYELMASGVSQQIKRLSAGSTVTHLSVPECKKFKIRVPSIFEQEDFSQIINKVEINKKLLSFSYKNSVDFFNALSKKAFSGQL